MILCLHTVLYHSPRIFSNRSASPIRLSISSLLPDVSYIAFAFSSPFVWSLGKFHLWEWSHLCKIYIRICHTSMFRASISICRLESRELQFALFPIPVWSPVLTRLWDKTVWLWRLYTGHSLTFRSATYHPYIGCNVWHMECVFLCALCINSVL